MIERCRGSFPVTMMCRLMKVSSTGYYDWRTRKPSSQAQANSRLLRKIKSIHQESDGVFGSPRVWDELRYQGETCSLNRIARIMKRAAIKGIPAKRQWSRKKSNIRPSDITNHLERNFNADAPDVKWVTDITYIRTGEGWLYLAVIIDLYSRKVIGWSMSHKMEKELVIQAVLMAIWQKGHQETVILHSDRGSQYTSHEYQYFLKTHGIVSSMSAVGSCYDNAAAESFFGVLKRERVNRRRYITRAEARSDIFDYIERFYNQRKERKLTRSITNQITLN